jgi:hypothetical protein
MALNEECFHSEYHLCRVSFMLSVIFAECHKQAHYTEVHYAKWTELC